MILIGFATGTTTIFQLKGVRPTRIAAQVKTVLLACIRLVVARLFWAWNAAATICEGGEDTLDEETSSQETSLPVCNAVTVGLSRVILQHAIIPRLRWGSGLTTTRDIIVKTWEFVTIVVGVLISVPSWYFNVWLKRQPILYLPRHSCNVWGHFDNFLLKNWNLHTEF